MDFGLPYVESVEAALESREQLRGRWRRLNSVSSNPSASALKPVAAWAVKLPQTAIATPGVSEIWVLIDSRFPISQPRVVAPGIHEDGTWPHVEDDGRLCLGSSAVVADAGSRVIVHIAEAVELLNYNAAKRRSEFQSEICTYWQRGSSSKVAPEIRSLVTPTGPSREAWCFCDTTKRIHFWGESKDQLRIWLRNARYNPSEREIQPAWLVWLPEAPTPLEFPKLGGEVLAHIPGPVQERLIHPGAKLPVLIGAPTEAGNVWVGAELDIATQKELTKGFRPGRYSFTKAINSMATRPISRLPVERIDGTYVHGRGHNEQYEDLAKLRVAIVGCGSLGSVVARLLAQAGVGTLLLVDSDELKSHNTSRHVLGNSSVGMTKTKALAGRLESDFPHQGPHRQFATRFELLTPNQLDEFRKCDLIISAGIDLAGDSAITAWRLGLAISPPHVCTWLEPFAIVGHAIALFDDDDLRTLFDKDGYPKIQTTQWPPEIAVEIREAGCGNVFQPHGAVDVQRTAATAATLCLDIFGGGVEGSIRRSWHGDLQKLTKLGGIPSAEFSLSSTEVEKPWSAVTAAGAAT